MVTRASARAAARTDALEDRLDPSAAMGIAGAQHGGDELMGLAVEDQQRVEHVLAVEAVVGAPFLRPMGRVIRPIEVEDDVGRDAVALPLAQIHLPQRQCQTVAASAIHRVLQPGERRLAGQIAPRLRQAAAHQFEEGVGAERVGVILIFIPTRDLEDALAEQRFQRVAHRPAPPVGDHVGEGGAQPQGRIGLFQPRQPAVGGQAPAVKAGLQRQRGSAREAMHGCGRLAHAGTSWFGLGSTPHPYQRGAPLSSPTLMNNPG